MSASIVEHAQSRSFDTGPDGTTLTTRWVIIGTQDELQVNSLLLDCPTFFDGLIRTRIGKAEPQGGGLWFADIEYSNGRGAANLESPAGETPQPGQPPPGGLLSPDQPMPSSISFTTTGGTAHITQSIQTVSKIRATSRGGPGGAADNQQAIGLKRNGVEGCDVITAKMEFTWQVKVPRLTFDQMKTLFKVTAKTNNAVWKGFAVGELLYLGAEGQPGERNTTVITHRFAYNENLLPNHPDLVISRLAGVADLTLPAKKGWEYVWCAYKDTIAGTELYPIPIAAYVEQVYRNTDFGLLGLGG